MTDVVIPRDVAPSDLPATDSGVRAEMDGTSSYAPDNDLQLVKDVRKWKNVGINAALPPHTLHSVDGEPVVLTLRHFQTFYVRSAHGENNEAVRRKLSLSRTASVPERGAIAVNGMTMMNAIQGCSQGIEVDIAGAVEANRMRQDGLWVRISKEFFPGSDGIQFQLRTLAHPYLRILDGDATKDLKEKMLIPEAKPLPAFARPEVDRRMILASIVKARGTIAGVDLSKFDTYKLRAWIQEHLMPAPDFRESAPAKAADRFAYFERVFADCDGDFLPMLLERHAALGRVANRDLLMRGDGFLLGDLDHTQGSGEYRPSAPPVTLRGMDPAGLRKLFQESFFPDVPLREHLPDDPQEREEYCLRVYKGYNNGLLNELLQLEDAIRNATPGSFVGKGHAFIAGVDD